MRLLVTGCGSGGTNLGLELVRSLNFFDVLEGSHGKGTVEDRQFFTKLREGTLSENAATKLATESSPIDRNTILKALDEFEDLRVLFVFRNPVDTCLSKIDSPWRERPSIPSACLEAGLATLDKAASLEELISDTAAYVKPSNDHLLGNAVQAVKNMYQIYFLCKKEYSNRVHEIKMEDMILDRNKVRKDLSQWFGIEYDGKDPEFWKASKKHEHQLRYHGQLAPNVDLYKDLENSYDGRFKEYQEHINKIAECFREEMEHFKYE